MCVCVCVCKFKFKLYIFNWFSVLVVCPKPHSAIFFFCNRLKWNSYRVFTEVSILRLLLDCSWIGLDDWAPTRFRIASPYKCNRHTYVCMYGEGQEVPRTKVSNVDDFAIWFFSFLNETQKWKIYWIKFQNSQIADLHTEIKDFEALVQLRL